jgi:hypothetical protein
VRMPLNFDAIILPDMSKDALESGRRRADDAIPYEEEMPPEYRGALGKDGGAALTSFVENGGTLIAFAGASDYAIDLFDLPVRNTLAKVKSEDFSVPGSLVRLRLRTDHPVNAGMPAEVAAFIDRPIAFETTSPGPEMQRWVLASYPENADEILLSGWIRGEERLANKAAAVAVTFGKGKVVLFGFRPQNRGQTHATFPMVFNSLYWSVQ